MDFENYQSQLTREQKNFLKCVETGTLRQVTDYACPLLVGNTADNELFRYITLVTALRRNHKSISKVLIKRSYPAKVPQKTGHFCTSLYYAVKMRDLNIFKMLWEGGASIFDKDANEDTALELAMILEEDTIISYVLSEILLPKNLENLKIDQENEIALFHAACYSKNSEAIEIFLSRNFALDSRSSFKKEDWRGFTPLHFSLQRYRYSWTQNTAAPKLLRDDVDLFATDGKGKTPVHHAFRNDPSFLIKNKSMIKGISCLHENRFTNPVDEFQLSHFHIVCSVKFNTEDDVKEHIEYVKFFIDNGVDLNSAISLKDERFPGYTALHLIVENSCWGILELLLMSGANPNMTEKNGFTPLHLLCSRTNIEPKKRLELVKLLLLHGADPVAKDPEDRTPLHASFYARMKDYSRKHALDETEILFLSRNHDSVNHIDKQGISYLHLACTRGDTLKFIKTLVMNGALTNSCVQTKSRHFADYSPLHFAALFIQVDIAKFLISQGADVNYATKFEETPLHLACYEQFERNDRARVKNTENTDNIEWFNPQTKQIQMIELLLKHGAFVNARGSSGYTALLYNCSYPHSFFYEYDYYGRDKPSECFLNELFTRQERIMIILLQHGADINVCNEYTGTVLHYLCEGYEIYPFRKQLIELALKNGANINATNKRKGFTPLHKAVEVSVKNKSDTSLIDLLLENGSNVNAKCSEGNTPLHVAVEPHYYYTKKEIHAVVLTKLLNHPDIDINVRNKHGRTPLHLAIDRTNCTSTEKLLECRANFDIVDNLGSSPIYSLVERLQKEPDILNNDEKFRKILGTFVIHVNKLKRLGLHVSENVHRDFTLLSQYLSKDYLARVDSQIVQELALLKTRRLNSHTSFYDILFKDSIAMSKYTLNGDLRTAISSIIAKSAFTYFGNFIKRQYDRGCRRRSLTESAKSALNVVTQFSWPCCCSDQILSHLSDQDLKKLVQSVPRIHGKNRRSASDVPLLEESAAKAPRLDDENHCNK